MSDDVCLIPFQPDPLPVYRSLSEALHEETAIFQAGPATDAEVKNSLRLFGKYVIPHFKAKERGAQAARPSAAV